MEKGIKCDYCKYLELTEFHLLCRKWKRWFENGYQAAVFAKNCGEEPEEEK